MPLQNRVTPRGDLVACVARGTFMGNRGGTLHDENRHIVRHYASRRWISCLLQFKGRRRTVMSPRRYTELFFLDEAVSLAAGHRPCAECRRQRFNAFRQAWIGSSSLNGTNLPGADEMDVELHRARIDSRKAQVTYPASLNALPDDCFVQLDGNPYLIRGDELLLWSPDGYLKKRDRPTGLTVTVLTPEPTVRCLRNGYRAEIHTSALSL